MSVGRSSDVIGRSSTHDYSAGELLLIEAGNDAEADMLRRGGPADDDEDSIAQWAKMIEAVHTRDRIMDRVPPVACAGDPLDLRLSLLPMTDLGNAERFAERYRHRFLWCNELGWLHWDGVRWSTDDGDARAGAASHQLVRAIQAEARALKGSDRNRVVVEEKGKKADVWLSDKLAQWGRASESRSHLSAIVELARPMLSIRPHQLDADPLKINVMNGTLHCRRPDECGEDEDFIVLRPHDPADRITKLAPVIFDPEAAAPRFDRFLGVVQPDLGQRRFLQAWAGYSATGLTIEQKLVFNYGRGKNGKSTFVDACCYVLDDYSDTVPIETFLDQGNKRKGSDASPDVAGLKGVRTLRTSEPEKNSKLGEAFIKLVTGGEPLKVRFLNKDFFTLRPEFKLTISGNYRPQIGGTDDGIWRRMILVPWLVSIPTEDIDRSLPLKLKAEASGILNFILDGLRDWLENGLTIPDTIVEATQAYRRDSDPLGQFLSLCVVEEPGAREQSSKLYALFHAWAKWAGERDWTQKGFSQAMKDRGYRTIQNDVIWWRDIRAIKVVEDFIGAPSHHDPAGGDVGGDD